jgi:DNA-binding transcriptional regulator GbsR (MarR family)
MDSDIKKEHFINDNFDVKQFLNARLKPNYESESDIFNFKLTMIQREFVNEMELNMNNLLKFSKILETDINQTQSANKNIKNSINELDKYKLDNNKLEELNKIVRMKNKNKKIEKCLNYIC